MKRLAYIGRKQALSRTILSAGASALALGMATGAQAQDTEQPPQETVEQTTVDDAAIDEEAAAQPGERDIIVTGSRIPRAGFDTVRPIESITAEDLDKRAFTNIADALEELPTVEVDTPGDQDTFVLGQNFVDLFGLGSQRTLTLVNGRRFVSSNPQAAAITSSIESGLQVNFGAIPSILVERIDVAKLASGAAVYGSDAIAGTINIILKDDFEGIDLRVQQSIAEDGDLNSWHVSGVIGANLPNDRGNVALAIQYDKSNSALYANRPRFGVGAPNLVPFPNGLGPFPPALDADGDGDIDSEFRIYDGRQTSIYSEYGSIAPFPPGLFLPAFGLGALSDGNFYKFDGGGQLVECQPGLGLLDILTDYGGDCGSNFFEDLTLRPEVRRLNIAGIGHYDISDSIRFTIDAIVSDIKSVEPQNDFAVNTGLFGGTSGALIVSTSNPFLPDQARSILEANGVTRFGVNREADDLIDDGRLEGESLTWRVAAGLDGNFSLGERRFNWNVSGVYGSADIKSRHKTIINQRLVNAIDAVRNADGEIVCGVNADADPANNMPDCLPVNIFGDAQVLNSQAALDFVQGGELTGSNARNEQYVATASITGEIFQLPAGWMKANIGAETRHEENSFDPLPLFTSPAQRFPTIGPTGGELDTLEGFAEVLVPLTSPEMDVPFLHLLEVSASARYVHDKSRSRDGTLDSSNNSWVYEMGGRWSPIEDIIIRGSYTRAVRSPALVELFRPDVVQNAFGTDPCDMAQVDLGLVPDTRRANCIAAGLDPDTFNSNLGQGIIVGRASGNPDLQPETSKAFNIGAVIQPRWIDRLALSIDYYSIEIEDQVTPLTLTQILESCYDDPNFPNSEFCSDELFVRDPATGFLTFVRVRPFNVASANYKAVEARLIWGTKLADLFGGNKDLGDLGLDFTILRQIDNKTDPLGNGDVFDAVGSFATPKWAATASATYALGDVRLFWRTLWQDAPRFGNANQSYIVDLGLGDEFTPATLEDVVSDDIRDRFIHYASVQFKVMDRFSFQFNVDNVFNRKPTRVEQVAGAFSTDEIFGRRFTFQANINF